VEKHDAPFSNPTRCGLRQAALRQIQILSGASPLDITRSEWRILATDRHHTALCIVSLIMFYFSAAPVLQWTGRPEAGSAVNMKQRKHTTASDFIRHGSFTHPNFPMP